MQRAPMLGVGPVQGIRTNPALLSNNPQVGVVSGLSRRTYRQQFLQPQQQSVFEQLGSSQQGKMDDLFEQMFSLPSWPETGGMSRAPWDYNAAGSANAMSVEAAGSLPGPQKLFTMSLMPSAMPGSSTGSQGLSSRNREMQDNINNHPQADDGAQYSFDDSLIATRLQQQQRGLQDALVGSTTATAGQQQLDIRATTLSQANQEAAQNSMRRLSEGMTATGPVALQLNTGNPLAGNTSVSQVLAAVAGSARATGLVRSPSVGSSVSEASGVQQPLTDGQAGPPVAPMWRQPYTGGVLALPLNVGQAKAEAFLSREGTSNDAHLLGKRSRDDEEARAGPQENLFNSFVGQMGQSQTARTAGQQSHQQMQSGHGVSVPPYASHTGLAQPQGAAAVVAGTARPRVRARRGQATDPHSIAERLRRERIAERMKALQDLVPNSNKTDKASMLDEIIEYVKFLQLQVKVLSMSRLGGAGAVAPLVADLPAEGQNNFVATLGRSGGASGPSQDGMVATERQVARLMEENMGSAMQFLQGKGLCLMPISLATAISSTNPRPPTGPQGGVQGLASGDRPRLDASSSTPASSSNTVASGVMVSSSNSGDGVGNDPASKGGSGAVRSSKDSIQASAADKVNGVGSGLPASGAKSGIKSNEEASRRAP